MNLLNVTLLLLLCYQNQPRSRGVNAVLSGSVCTDHSQRLRRSMFFNRILGVC